MSINYKFQDLAKFIEDVKFLIARGGGGLFPSPGSLAGKTIPEIILRIVWLVILWILIFILVYVVYKTIFKGYPRFPVDLLKLKFYNKVDVKSAVGDPNGLLYDSIHELSADEMKDALAYYGKSGYDFGSPSIFQEVKDAIVKEYQPEYNTDGTKEALSDYYKYFIQINNHLGLKGQSSSSKVAFLKSLYDDVFANYINWYLNEVVSKERMFNCILNNGKTDDKRGQIAQKKKQLEREYDDLLHRVNCKKIATTCEFAKLFVDPDVSLECKGDNKTLINKWLKQLGYDAPRLRYRQLEREIRNDKRSMPFKLPAAKKRAKERIKWKTEEQKKLKMQMIDIQKQAIANAEAEARTVKLPSINNATSKDIIDYDTPARIAPNTSRTKADKDKINYIVYVPCYELYKQYYNIHRDKMFKSLDKTMSVDEIVAYIFLTDLEKVMENNEVAMKLGKGNSAGEDDSQLPATKPTLIGKFLQLHMTIENMAGLVESTLLDVKNPINYAQYMVFPDDETVKGAVTELVKYNKQVVPFYQMSQAAPGTEFLKAYEGASSKMVVKYDYTFYLMELFAYLSADDPGMYDNYVRHLNSYAFNRNSLITFLNMPMEKQNDPKVMESFKISKGLLAFIRRHPIFSTVFLGDAKTNNKETYAMVMQLFMSVLQDNQRLAKKAAAVDLLDVGEAELIVKSVEEKVLNLKKANASLHMIHLYFARYRDSFHERDAVTKSKISRDGFVEIYDQHNISYEFGSFFARLFEPFKQEFVDGRIKASWNKAFYAPRFNPNLKQDKRNISYWRDFNAFWVDYMGKKMDDMMKSWWKNFKNYTKPKF